MSFDASEVFALFEDNLAQPARARLLHDLQETVVCTEPEALDTVLAHVETLRRQGFWLAIAANYELGIAFEPRLRGRPREASDPLLRAWAFRCAQEIEGEALGNWWREALSTLSPQARTAGILRLSPSLAQADYERKVGDILRLIDAGDCYQTNLTFPLRGRYFGHPLALFARLRDAQPVPHGALLHTGDDNWILSRSPELFVARQGDSLRCRPMKGTVARDDTLTEEDAYKQLLTEKNRAENLMIVDLIRNDLGRLAPAGGVKVSKLFEVERYRTVYQLTSTVTAGPIQADLGATLRALFPCGSVTGAPKIRAMEIISTLENEARGLYCGALGHLSPQGDYVFSVPIRSLLLTADHACRLDVGSGIVADSNPSEEYAECIAKARFVTTLRDELTLLETMRFDSDTGGIALLELHIERLHRSAHALGFTLDVPAVRHAINDATRTLAHQPHRIRLVLHRDGRFELATAALDAPPEFALLALSPDALDARDPRLLHKTNARSFYDDALRHAIANGCFDVLFFNQRGELCEGARSNVFVQKGGHLLTPPLRCGLLPGILRASLLAAGQAEEAILTREALEYADAIWVGNALRGLLPARLVEPTR